MQSYNNQQSKSDELLLIEFQEACVHYRQIEQSRDWYMLFFFAISLLYVGFCVWLLKDLKYVADMPWLITGVLSLSCLVFAVDLFLFVSIIKIRVSLKRYVDVWQWIRQKIYADHENKVKSLEPYKTTGFMSYFKAVYSHELIVFIMACFCVVLFALPILGIFFLVSKLTLIQYATVWISFFVMCLMPFFFIKKHPSIQQAGSVALETKSIDTEPKKPVEETSSFFVGSRDKKMLEAFTQGDVEAVRALIEKGAKVNLKTEDGLSLLILATKKSDVAMVKLLLDNGADANIRDKSGWTALIWAAMLGYTNAGAADAPPKREFNDSETALFMAEMYRTPQANTLHAQHEIVQLLLDKGIDVNAKGNHGKSALMIAAIKGDTTIIEMLLNKGVNVNDQDGDGNTSLILAVANGHKQTVTALLKHGANVRAKTKKGETAMLFAKRKGNAEIIKLLDPNS